MDLREVFKQSVQEGLGELIRHEVRQAIRAELPAALRASQYRWVGVKRLSQLTGLCERKIRYLLRQGRLPHHRIGRKVLFDLNEVENWLQDHYVPPALHE